MAKKPLSKRMSRQARRPGTSMKVNRAVDLHFPAYYFYRPMTDGESLAVSDHAGVDDQKAFRVEALKQMVMPPVLVHKVEQLEIAQRTQNAQMSRMGKELAGVNSYLVHILESLHKALGPEQPEARAVLASVTPSETHFSLSTVPAKAFMKRLKMQMREADREQEPVSLPFEDEKVLRKYFQQQTSQLWDGTGFFDAPPALRRAALWRYLDNKICRTYATPTHAQIMVTVMDSVFSSAYQAGHTWTTRGSQSKEWTKLTDKQVAVWIMRYAFSCAQLQAVTAHAMLCTAPSSYTGCTLKPIPSSHDRFMRYEHKKHGVVMNDLGTEKSIRARLSNVKQGYRARGETLPPVVVNWPRPPGTESHEARDDEESEAEATDSGSVTSRDSREDEDADDDDDGGVTDAEDDEDMDEEDADE
jgi:hypothetical protein